MEAMPSRLPILLIRVLPALLPILCAAQVSEKMHEQITASLPKYDPKAADAKAASSNGKSPVGTPAPLSDDPLVQMPVFEVRSRRAQAAEADAMLTKAGQQEQALREYKNSMTTLDWLLNCFCIPLLTPSPQARADEAYRERRLRNEMESISNVVEAISKLDPAEGKKLEHDMDLDRHPGN